MRLSPKFGAIAAACCATALLLVGCTINSSNEQREAASSTHFDAVSETLFPRLNSYAVQTTEEPSINAHFFGITGASSLSDAMEDEILTTFKDGGAFHQHRAFDPVLTDPGERWDAEEFIEDHGENSSSDQRSGVVASAEATDDRGEGTDHTSSSRGQITVNNSVIAAGGGFLISRLTTAANGKRKQYAYVTDLDKNVTNPAADLLSSGDRSNVGAMIIDDQGLPVIDGDTFGEEELSDLGTQVHAALGQELNLPPDSKSYLPDYTCELIPCTALTYDDGPANEKMTKELTGYLKDADLRATFYQIGGNVRQHQQMSKKLLEMGNEVGNHSWSHPKLDALSAPQLKKEIEETDEALAREGVTKTTQLRPPYGSTSKTVDQTANKQTVQWNIDTQDWQTRNTSQTIESGSKAGPGSIILMHSIHETTVEAAPQLYKNLKAKGLYPVPTGYLFKGLPFETRGEYYCRGYGSPLCSNPEHPMVEKGKSMAKPARVNDRDSS